MSDYNFSIEAKNLNKKYNKKGGVDINALIDLNINIPRGSIYGLLGPNGAGKSTFINILGSLVIKDSGKVKICGIDIDENAKESRKKIGIVPQELNIDPFFTPKETLNLQAGMYGIWPKERITQEILRVLDLEDKADAYARELSGGMRRRLLVAKAMVHRPPILILDEPTAGVDIELRKQLWSYVRKLNEHGTTIILTTHYLEEAEELCETIAILDKGKIVRCASTKELLEDVESKTIILKTSEKTDPKNAVLSQLGASIDADNNLKINYNPKIDNSRKILEMVENSGVSVVDFEVVGASLETVFLSITSRK